MVFYTPSDHAKIQKFIEQYDVLRDVYSLYEDRCFVIRVFSLVQFIFFIGQKELIWIEFIICTQKFYPDILAFLTRKSRIAEKYILCIRHY